MFVAQHSNLRAFSCVLGQGRSGDAEEVPGDCCVLRGDLWGVPGHPETTLTAPIAGQELGAPQTEGGALGPTGWPYHSVSADDHVCLAPGRPSGYLFDV